MVNLLNDCEFEWLGRADWVINSGGIKVSPEQVEKNLANHISVPFAITSLPDVKLGECVVLVLEGGNKLNSSELVKKTNLLSYHVPRKQISIEQLPLLENGKLDRLELRKMVIQLTNTK
jgi:O-succinylbenzoic acid--CoA ligase